MTNTISLSSDLNTLYLIDNGRVIPFDLRKPEGVLIGKIQAQVVAATGISTGKSADKDAIILPVKANSQYTFTYNKASAGLGLIGATDIIQTITAPGGSSDPSGNCELQLFSLNEYNLHVYRTEKTLVITRLPKAC